MYKDFFGFVESPFSIVPNARYLYLSQRHREAITHLQAGLGEGGGFAMLTGEVGTGKTTVSKAMLASLPGEVRAGLLLNPTYSSSDLLEAICDEFKISYPAQASLKTLSQAISQYLVANHGEGLQTLLVIDEAQHLSVQVLEQLRLLTNLETDSQKLLKVLLIGQPELQANLQTTELRQLAQRITGRYHLLPLSANEVLQYIQFRVEKAGGKSKLFSSAAVNAIAKHTQGVPRLINLICDKSLQYAYQSGETSVTGKRALMACHDIMSFQAPMSNRAKSSVSAGYLLALGASLLFAGGVYLGAPYGLNEYHAYRAASAVEAQAAQPAEIAVETSLQPYLAQAQDKVIATLELYKVWGLKASVMDASCNTKSHGPYYCEQGRAGFEAVVKANRPVVVTLAVGQGRSYAVLYRLTRDSAELLIAQRRIQVPRQWLEQHWQGEYQYLWHSPIQQTLKLGLQGAGVAQLERLVSSALGEPSTGSDQFDEALKQKVQAFQRWQGLGVDGIAGHNTLIQLDSVLNTKAPSLSATLGVQP